MKILTVHADYIEIEPKQKAIKLAEEIKPEKKRYEEILVVFTSVEQDDKSIDEIAKKTSDEIDKVAKQIRVNNILIYPLVHLTSKPSSPQIALEVINAIKLNMKAIGYVIDHSPFGWYKGYTLKCKGHPLSELSREIKTALDVEVGKNQPTTIRNEEVISTSFEQEEKIKSKFYILDIDGNFYDVEKFDYSKHATFKKMVKYETKKVRSYEIEPPHIKLMCEHGLVGYEPGSDSGNFRWHPKGRLMKKILERAITDFCINYGAFEVETPIMYDFEHPSLKKYLNRFPARQYVVLSDKKKFFLRFSACFGQFLILHDMILSYKQLPFKMYELTKYSFRKEQGGELAGLKRLRTFTMPDMHTMTLDINETKEEFRKQFNKCLEWNRDLNFDELEIAFRAQTDFFEQNKDWYIDIVKKIDKPIFIELFDERYAYFITKFEFNFIDAMDKASTLSTVQVDVENAETYDINYINNNGQKQRPYILHASISGSIERVIYALLEKEAMKIKNGKKGIFPLWISPIQLRIIPIGEKHIQFAKELQERANGRKVRVDIDDSAETLSKKIRNAEIEWCPYIAVVGDKEMNSGKLAVTIRETGKKEEMDYSELLSEIEKKTESKPFEPISFGKTTSTRPL